MSLPVKDLNVVKKELLRNAPKAFSGIDQTILQESLPDDPVFLAKFTEVIGLLEKKKRELAASLELKKEKKAKDKSKEAKAEGAAEATVRAEDKAKRESAMLSKMYAASQRDPNQKLLPIVNADAKLPPKASLADTMKFFTSAVTAVVHARLVATQAMYELARRCFEINAQFEEGKNAEGHFNNYTNKKEFFQACIDDAAAKNNGEKPISTPGQMYQAVALWKLFRNYQGLLLVAATEFEWLECATFIRAKLAEDKHLADLLAGKGEIRSSIHQFDKARNEMVAFAPLVYKPATEAERAFISANMGDEIVDAVMAAPAADDDLMKD